MRFTFPRARVADACVFAAAPERPRTQTRQRRGWRLLRAMAAAQTRCQTSTGGAFKLTLVSTSLPRPCRDKHVTKRERFCGGFTGQNKTEETLGWNRRKRRCKETGHNIEWQYLRTVLATFRPLHWTNFLHTTLCIARHTPQLRNIAGERSTARHTSTTPGHMLYPKRHAPFSSAVIPAADAKYNDKGLAKKTIRKCGVLEELQKSTRKV